MAKADPNGMTNAAGIAYGELIRRQRKAKKMSQEELGALARVKKNAVGAWESYNGYGVDYSGLPLGHGEKSVIRLLRWGLEMKDDEIIAIRWHMSGFDLAFQSPEILNNYGAA